jgi:LysM repeat protein
MASPAIPSATSQRTIVTDVMSRVGQTPQLLSARQVATTAKATTYTVRSGDTLSTIAKHVYNDQAAWPVIYYANRKQITDANQITAGQVLKIPAKPAHLPKAPAAFGPAAVVTTASSASSGSGSTVADSTYSGSGGFASCVIARESGGNSQVMNSSGHYGLYQFSESTWEAYGGSASDFGNASVAEQNQVFDNALARGGESNWSAYDGC